MALDAHVTRLPGCRRKLVPTYEHMIATEPLPEQTWKEIGLARRGLFGDFCRLFTYAQRTADDRIAIGGRNFDYHYGSAIHPRFEKSAQVERMLVDSLRELLPQLGSFSITHRWGSSSNRWPFDSLETRCSLRPYGDSERDSWFFSSLH